MINNNYNGYTPTFGAKCITTGSIKQLEKGCQYLDRKVSFVELEFNNPKDLAAIRKLEEYWKGARFTDQIRGDFERGAQRGQSQDSPYKVYALTLQQGNFGQLNHKKILGITDVTQFPEILSLERMEVKPSIREAETPKVKRAGSAMLDAIKSIYSKDKEIRTQIVPGTEKFYTSNGFYEDIPRSNIYVYPKTEG